MSVKATKASEHSGVIQINYTGGVSRPATILFTNNRGILVYNICLISISDSVSDGATNKSVLNIEDHSMINSTSEYGPGLLNTYCTTRVTKILQRMYELISAFARDFAVFERQFFPEYYTQKAKTSTMY